MHEHRSIVAACRALARRAMALPLALTATVAVASTSTPTATPPKPPAAKAQPAKTQPSKTQPAKAQTAKTQPAKPQAKSAAPAAQKPSTAAAKAPPPRAAAKPANAAAPVTTASLGKPDADRARPGEAGERASFAAFVAALWPEAQQRGVTRATFDEAFAGITPDSKIIELTRRQSEFVKPIWEYVNGAVTASRVEQGAEAGSRHASAIASAESRYGVERSVILGIWGMETNFGSFTGGKDVIRSLATLAHERYRGEFFRDELLTALVILQQRHVDREDMKGSWAGAMGQTQFMPSSFMKFAVDGDGDGHKNIWTSIPDAMASTANYLRQHGWTPGLPWGFEIVLPEGFDWRLQAGSFSQWQRAGVRRADGAAMPRSGEASLFLPAGARGPAFLVTANFAVIKRYNSSDAYALGVGHLGDRIMGGAAIAGRWPVGERQLDRGQRLEVQRHLNRLGFDVGEPDGKLGSKTREAVRGFQASRGLVPDGYPTVALLEALRTVR